MVFKKGLSLIIITALLFTGFLGPLALETEAVDMGWQLVGSAGFTTGYAWETCLQLDNNGIPYIVFQDRDNEDKATVMKYNGDTWEIVGSAGFSDGQAQNPTIAFDSTNTLFAAYRDGGNSYGATVKKFNGSNWVNVGTPGFSEASIDYIKIAFNNYIDTPHVVYQDWGAANGKATVMQYSSSTEDWVALGEISVGVSDSVATFTDIVIDENNYVYIAYKDGNTSLTESNQGAVTVRKYDFSSWTDVGTPAFSDGIVNYVDLEMYDGVPYVAFQDKENGWEITVMKFNGSEWEVVGIKGFTDDGDALLYAEEVSLRFDNYGNPYVATLQDIYDYNDSFVVYKYINSEWMEIGSYPTTTDYTYSISLDIDSENVLYVGFRDGENADKATVMKYVQPEVPADETIDISDIQGIAPVIGESPSSTIETSQYTGSIDWSPEDSAFDYETIYTATITLTPKAGYTLDGVVEDFFNVYGATSTANDADSGIITAVFPITDANWQMVGDSFTDIYTEGLEVEDDFYINAIDVSIDSQGTPYVAMIYKINYGGVESQWKSAVKKYETNQWIDLNSSEISDASTQYINIEMNNNNMPVIAFYEHDYIMETACIRIKEWDGSTWQTIGDTSRTGSHSPGVFDFKLYGGVPYLAYGDWDGDPYGSAAVIKYENDEWMKIGENLSDGAAWALNLALDSNGYPYISYVKQGTPYHHIVQSYNGQSWETMKNYTDKDVSTAYYSDIILDSTNTAYLAYKDTNNNNEASVVKWHNDSWELVGLPGFTDDGNENSVSSLEIKLDSDDKPILSVSHNTYQTGQKADYAYKYKSNQWIALRSDYFSTYLYNIGLDTYQNNAYLAYAIYDSGIWHGYLLEYIPTEGSITPPPTPRPTPSIPALVIETKVLPDGHEGEEYELQLEAAGGRKPYSWTASGLPEGLEINVEGKIYGIPQSAGDFMIKLELLDNRNYYRSSVLELYIEEKEEEIEEPEFTDITGHWLIDFLRRVFYRGIIVGYPDRTFRPDSIVTRGEFAAMIIRTFKLDPIAGTLFTDTSGYWGESNINGAVGRGIITGYTDNSFRPNVPITREEMAVMLSRALNIEEDIIEDYFDDIGTASPWARLSIRRLGNLKILTGFPDGTFRPKNTLTRAEAVKVIYEIISNE
ncbi:MAG: S-layer homology domain-containing protein [Dethiosulfatibacter sp.]|nr:S-layer homology domain-containing protein [Dethiosulfatibacter sp.]